jgi:2'-5' RNA ligase
LFVGVELEDDVREAAAQIADSLKRTLGPRVEARWIPAANLHITLWFLGEVQEARVDSVVAALGPALAESSFDVEISGMGAFPPAGPPRVFWLGVTRGADALTRLNAELTSRLEPVGFAPERRAYSAHLTIARVKDVSRALPARDLRVMLRESPAHAGISRVNAVTLFRSHTSPKGATYEGLQRLRLK